MNWSMVQSMVGVHGRGVSFFGLPDRGKVFPIVTSENVFPY